MTQETGNQPEVKLLPIAEMEKMSHAELYRARINAKTPEEQKHIAPYEHRAFAREYTEENPVTGAVGLAVAIPAYQAAKATGLTSSRTGVDTKQMVEGYKGIAEGLVAPWKRVWNRVEESVTEKPPETGPKPWERAWNKDKPTPPAQAASVPTRKLNSRDRAIAAALAMTPQEIEADRLRNLTDENVAELEREMKNASPSALAILKVEYDKIIEERKKLRGK